MNSYKKLLSIIERKNSILCVGLDSDIKRLPEPFPEAVSSLFEFNREIIDATRQYAAAYKINFAFYEQYGTDGLKILEETVKYIGNDEFVIADSKRGDIGNTSTAYAYSAYNYFKSDSMTAAPYMGMDSVKPFLNFTDKLTFILALTSNPGSNDFQRLIVAGKPLYRIVIEKALNWGTKESLGFVVGATHPVELSEIREYLPDNFLLIPGVGTQGGNVEEIIKANGNSPCIINVSRDIIYADKGNNFVEAASKKSSDYRDLFNSFR